MCLCLKTYGIEPLMRWPINAMNVLNLSFFFFFFSERLPKHRAKEQCVALTVGQDMTCFFYFFGKLTF